MKTEDGACLPLEGLKFIADGIAVIGNSFLKISFFNIKGSVRLHFQSNFRDLILRAIPDEVPSFEEKLVKMQLTRPMFDSEILDELGNLVPFTVSEFAAVIRGLLEKQSKGESGTLLANGCANIFYVKLVDGRIVAVGADWLSVARDWSLGAYILDYSRWLEGRCVFFRC